MKDKILIIIIAAGILGMTSCEDTTSDKTSTTNFPSIKMLGENPIAVPLGEDYVDAGVYSELLGDDVSADVEISSNVIDTVGGVYSVSYTVTSTDGFTRTDERQVIVCSLDYNKEDLAGTYTGNVLRTGPKSDDEAYSGNELTLVASSLGYGIYEISDWIGGFYDKGRDLGSEYAFTGMLQITATNEIVEISMSNPWGDPFDSVVGTYDPATGIIAYDANWLEGTYVFSVDMKIE